MREAEARAQDAEARAEAEGQRHAEAVAEKQRLQAGFEKNLREAEGRMEAERLRHADAEKQAEERLGDKSRVSVVQDGVVSSTSKLENDLRALDNQVGGTDNLRAACCVIFGK